MQARCDALQESEALNHTQELEKLKGEGVGEEHAKAMLERTASSEGSQSSFRALQLARVLMPQYRTAEMTAQFGSEPPGSKAIAYEVWRVAFYTESTLEVCAAQLIDNLRGTLLHNWQMHSRNCLTAAAAAAAVAAAARRCCCFCSY